MAAERAWVSPGARLELSGQEDASAPEELHRELAAAGLMQEREDGAFEISMDGLGALDFGQWRDLLEERVVAA